MARLFNFGIGIQADTRSADDSLSRVQIALGTIRDTASSMHRDIGQLTGGIVETGRASQSINNLSNSLQSVSTEGTKALDILYEVSQRLNVDEGTRSIEDYGRAFKMAFSEATGEVEKVQVASEGVVSEIEDWDQRLGLAHAQASRIVHEVDDLNDQFGKVAVKSMGLVKIQEQIREGTISTEEAWKKVGKQIEAAARTAAKVKAGKASFREIEQSQGKVAGLKSTVSKIGGVFKKVWNTGAKVLGAVFTPEVRNMERSVVRLTGRVGQNRESAMLMARNLTLMAVRNRAATKTTVDLTEAFGELGVRFTKLATQDAPKVQDAAIRLVDTFGMGAGQVAKMERSMDLLGVRFKKTLGESAVFQEKFGVPGLIEQVPNAVAAAREAQAIFGKEFKALGTTVTLDAGKITRNIQRATATIAKGLGKTAAEASREARSAFMGFSNETLGIEKVMLGLSSSFPPMVQAMQEGGLSLDRITGLLKKGQESPVEFAKAIRGIASEMNEFDARRFILNVGEKAPAAVRELIMNEEALKRATEARAEGMKGVAKETEQPTDVFDKQVKRMRRNMTDLKQEAANLAEVVRTAFGIKMSTAAVDTLEALVSRLQKIAKTLVQFAAIKVDPEELLELLGLGALLGAGAVKVKRTILPKKTAAKVEEGIKTQQRQVTEGEKAAVAEREKAKRLATERAVAEREAIRARKTPRLMEPPEIRARARELGLKQAARRTARLAAESPGRLRRIGGAVRRVGGGVRRIAGATTRMTGRGMRRLVPTRVLPTKAGAIGGAATLALSAPLIEKEAERLRLRWTEQGLPADEIDKKVAAFREKSYLDLAAGGVGAAHEQRAFGGFAEPVPLGQAQPRAVFEALRKRPRLETREMRRGNPFIMGPQMQGALSRGELSVGGAVAATTAYEAANFPGTVLGGLIGMEAEPGSVRADIAQAVRDALNPFTQGGPRNVLRVAPKEARISPSKQAAAAEKRYFETGEGAPPPGISPIKVVRPTRMPTTYADIGLPAFPEEPVTRPAPRPALDRARKLEESAAKSLADWVKNGARVTVVNQPEQKNVVVKVQDGMEKKISKERGG